MTNTVSAYHSVRKCLEKLLCYNKSQTRAVLGGWEGDMPQSSPYMCPPQGTSTNFYSPHINNPVLRRASPLHIMGPQSRNELVFSQVQKLTLSQGQRMSELHCVPSPRVICILRRIITSALGQAPQGKLSDPSRNGQRWPGAEESLPRNTDVALGRQAAWPGL